MIKKLFIAPPLFVILCCFMPLMAYAQGENPIEINTPQGLEAIADNPTWELCVDRGYRHVKY